MSTYTLNAGESVWGYNGNKYNVIELMVTTEGVKILPKSLDWIIEVDDGSNKVRNFQSVCTPNGRKFHARFATDAFAGLGSTVDVHLLSGEEVVHTFSGLNLGTLVQPAPAWITALGLPDADNAWVATI